ncbi:MAG: hypothetical protein EPO21_20080 [Chloroflexota bacterium]|nr:MAG: hypothetical protein EPO21_20080 [Chloroflexota bacterium]
MVAVPKTIRMPDEVRLPLEEEAHLARRDFSSVANELLLEGIKMRRIPGVVFADSPSGGRVARVAGTGLEVFEVVQAYRSMENSWDRLKAAFDWLSDTQLRSALAYAEAYPEEIEERIRRDEQWTAEAVWKRYPFMSPKRR